MNIVSNIIKELAQEFKLPETIDKNLLQKIIGLRKNKQKGVTERTDDGRIKIISDKGTER